MANKSNGSAETTAPTDTIPYDHAVSEGKEIVAQIKAAVVQVEVAERGQLRLGELADKLEPKYGDRTLAKFAAEIGVAEVYAGPLSDCYRAWAGKLAPGPISTSYAVLKNSRNIRSASKSSEKIRTLLNAKHRTDRQAQARLGEKQKQDREDERLKQSEMVQGSCRPRQQIQRAAGVVDKWHLNNWKPYGSDRSQLVDVPSRCRQKAIKSLALTFKSQIFSSIIHCSTKESVGSAASTLTNTNRLRRYM